MLTFTPFVLALALVDIILSVLKMPDRYDVRLTVSLFYKMLFFALYASLPFLLVLASVRNSERGVFWTKLGLGMAGVMLLTPMPLQTTQTLVEFGTQSMTALAIVSLYAQYIVDSSDRPNLKFALLNFGMLWQGICIFTQILDFSNRNIKEILTVIINMVLVLATGLVACKTSSGGGCLHPFKQEPGEEKKIFTVKEMSGIMDYIDMNVLIEKVSSTVAEPCYVSPRFVELHQIFNDSQNPPSEDHLANICGFKLTETEKREIVHNS